jgi:hypothetical protein
MKAMVGIVWSSRCWKDFNLAAIGMAAALVIAATSPLPMAAAGNVELVGAWPFGPSYTVTVDKGICYLGSGGGIYVLDVSNPAKPEKIAEHRTPGLVVGLAAQGELPNKLELMKRQVMLKTFS